MGIVERDKLSTADKMRVVTVWSGFKFARRIPSK